MAQNTRRPRARLDSGYEHLDGQGSTSRTTIPTCKLGAVSFGKGTSGASRRLVALLIAPQPPRPDSAPIGKRRIVCDNDIHGSKLPHLAEMYGYGANFRLREWREKHEVPKPLVADAAPTMQTVCLNESAPYPFIFATFFSCNQKCIRSIRKKGKKGGVFDGEYAAGVCFPRCMLAAANVLGVARTPGRAFSRLRALLGERSRRMLSGVRNAQAVWRTVQVQACEPQEVGTGRATQEDAGATRRGCRREAGGKAQGAPKGAPPPPPG